MAADFGDPWTLDDLESAAARLSGHVLTTPLLGQPLLPGLRTPAGLRLKIEILQQGGGVWFRGVMHALARKFGAVPRLVVAGPNAAILGTVCAAAAQRVPVTALRRSQADEDELITSLLEGFDGVTVQSFAGAAADRELESALQAELRAGAAAAPQPGEAEFDLGVATIGLELDRQMASDVDVVLVDPDFAAGPVAAALRVVGRECAVEASSESTSESAESGQDALTWRRRLSVGARIAVGDSAALACARAYERAQAGQSVVAVLGV